MRCMPTWRICAVLLLGCLYSLPLWAAQKVVSVRQGAAPQEYVLSADLESLSLMALSPNEGMAVLRTTDGALRTVRKDRQLNASGVRLVDVLPDRLVLLRHTAKGNEMVWMFPVSTTGKAPPLQIFSSVRPPAELHYRPTQLLVTASGVKGAPALSISPPSSK